MSEKTIAREIKEIIQKRVVEAGLNGAMLFFTMRERLMMPLAERRKPLWLYSGPSHSDRAFIEELQEDDVGADREDFKALAPFDCKCPPNLGLGHPRSRPRLLGGPEGRERQAAQQEAAREKRKKKGDRAVKREVKEREISCRTQHGGDRDKIREEYPSTSEAESSPGSDDGDDSEETWSGVSCFSAAGEAGDAGSHEARSGGYRGAGGRGGEECSERTTFGVATIIVRVFRRRPLFVSPSAVAAASKDFHGENAGPPRRPRGASRARGSPDARESIRRRKSSCRRHAFVGRTSSLQVRGKDGDFHGQRPGNGQLDR
ncbi:hypothetical protein C2845_PM07G38910 [Panicum miliaceum]|uniref:Uncharacterized protein n=1 Tax=Panicum miliaceum TaxID=4540 RepID=A0A3L6STY1_PANMI|nr:hypothetical protein C2845_PM07G38910 [Panicum miliaceum]